MKAGLRIVWLQLYGNSLYPPRVLQRARVREPGATAGLNYGR